MLGQMERKKLKKQRGKEVPRQRRPKFREEERRLQQPLEVANGQNEDGEEIDGETAIDGSVFDDLTWEVECTKKVWKTLLDKKVPHHIKETAIRRIQTLANGDWHGELSKPLAGLPKECDIKLYEAKLDKARRILWELTIVFSPRLTCTESDKMLESGIHVDDPTQTARYSEAIRVWDIVLDHSKVAHAMGVIMQKVNQGKKFKKRKSLMGISKGKTSKGTKFPTVFREVQSKHCANNDKMLHEWCPPGDDEYRIMKLYSFTSMLVNVVLNDSQVEVEFPFRVTELEHAIINLQPEPPSSILLLGRSGTGKTTCCVYRMWSRFVRYWQKTSEGPCWIPRDSLFTPLKLAEEDETHASNEQAPPNMDHLHQIFITKSQKLCAEVKQNFCNMVRGCQFAEEPLAQLDRPIPHRLRDIHQAQFPLFLTSRQFLLLLDASLPNPYFPRKADGSLIRQLNEAACSHPLPRRRKRGGLTERTKCDPRREVTYEVFAKELWPHINKKKIKCHPSLVWMEITSFIKGSFQALHSETGFLSLEEYLAVGKKMASNFSTDREEVYNMFKMYKHGNQQKNLFDEGDLVFHVYRRLRDVRTPDWAIHEFYVDETQDFTQAELSLLIQCAQDPNALFLTGDTAQSIMRGVAFRFKDLTSLFHYANQSVESRGKSLAVTVPEKVYHLTHNYRSHSGILNLAATVVDLLGHFFPLSFDRLLHDQGLFDGPLPVILDTSDVKDLPSLLRDWKTIEETSNIEFGADQVILVASASVKQVVTSNTASGKPLAMFDKGIVMTIEEAKGLEFNDVLLYNFFKDSEADKEWRVITGFKPCTLGDHQGEHLKTVEVDWHNSNNPPHRLNFNPEEHKILNSELKRLYTAITRARNSVWIFDEDKGKRLPMFDLLRSNRLVKVTKLEDIEFDSDYQGFAKPSSLSDWEERARYYADNDRLEAAKKCEELAAYHEKKQQEMERIRTEAEKKHRERIIAKSALRSKQLQKERWIEEGDNYFAKRKWEEAAECYMVGGDDKKRYQALYMKKKETDVRQLQETVSGRVLKDVKQFQHHLKPPWRWITFFCKHYQLQIETELQDLIKKVDKLLEIQTFEKAKMELVDKQMELHKKMAEDRDKGEKVDKKVDNENSQQGNGRNKHDVLAGKERGVRSQQRAGIAKVMEEAERLLEPQCQCDCKMKLPWCWIPFYCQNHNWNITAYQLIEDQLNEVKNEVDKLVQLAEYGHAKSILKEKLTEILEGTKQRHLEWRKAIIKREMKKRKKIEAERIKKQIMLWLPYIICVAVILAYLVCLAAVLLTLVENASFIMYVPAFVVFLAMVMFIYILSLII